MEKVKSGSRGANRRYSVILSMVVLILYMRLLEFKEVK